MPQQWFTSDTHFGHANIIKYSKRPFDNVEAMDKQLIENWNTKVQGNDVVYHLGDVGLGNPKYLESVLQKLHGRIILIRGNHDPGRIVKLRRFSDVIERPHIISHNGKRIVLLHYPMASWPHSGQGSIHLHGHCHGNMPPITNRLDVGVDCWEMFPISLEQILERNDANNRKERKDTASNPI